VKAQHPGWACCDLSQDLAGWIAKERAALADARLMAAGWHVEGAVMHAESARLAGTGDHDGAIEAAARSRAAHGRANAIMQSVRIREGHVDRVETAHAWRLSTAGGA